MDKVSTGLVSRIALRYVAGFLVLKGIIPQDIADMLTSDPEITALIGLTLMAVIEGAYALARKLGWAT
jgi:hypothetical protein